MKSVVKVEEEAMESERIGSFTAIGDPGCDGLGAEIMATFSRALDQSRGDIRVILGDIVPVGSKRYLEGAVDIIEGVEEKPTYSICGNHDTKFYEDYFGLRNYFVYDDRTLMIFLDDSKRVISDEALRMVREALSKYARSSVIIFLHIPPPNRVSSNSIPHGEWSKVTGIFDELDVSERLKYVVSGHIHSYFEDEVGSAKLVVTGGGGARIEDVDGIEKPYNHVVEFAYDESSGWSHSLVVIDSYSPFDWDDDARRILLEAFQGECMAHVRYRMLSEDAGRRGFHNLASLFDAASDAEYYHARNHFYTLGLLRSLPDAIGESIGREAYEVDKMYPEGIAHATEKGFGLPKYSFTDAFEVEKVHLDLFQEAQAWISSGREVPQSDYFTCTSCGYTFSSAGKEEGYSPKVCPVCGAPNDKIIGVKKRPCNG